MTTEQVKRNTEPEDHLANIVLNVYPK